MTRPSPSGAAPPLDGVLSDEWFGEDTAFDSGEDLAAALLAMAGIGPAGPSRSPDAAALDAMPVVAAPAPTTIAAAAPVAEFQVAEMPSFGIEAAHTTLPGVSAWRGVRPMETGTQRSGWSIRQSVQTLRLTEDILQRLREEAAELAWVLAAAARRELDSPS
jgi:hypothetical protein